MVGGVVGDDCDGMAGVEVVGMWLVDTTCSLPLENKLMPAVHLSWRTLPCG